MLNFLPPGIFRLEFPVSEPIGARQLVDVALGALHANGLGCARHIICGSVSFDRSFLLSSCQHLGQEIQLLVLRAVV